MIRILVDSAADYSLKELKEKNIEMIPLSITLNDTTYLDTVELERNHLYELLESTGSFPKTSQPSPEAFAAVFEDAKEKGDEVICILLSSALSGTCQSATLAKSMVEYDNIYIIDSLSATIAIKLMADYADKLRRRNVPAEEIVEKVEGMKSRTRIFAAIDTLEYLQRGGRISKTAAAIGSLANLKPIITVTEEGTVSIVSKCIGRNKAIAAVLKLLEEHPADTEFPIYPLYTYGKENAEKLVEKCPKDTMICTDYQQVGAAIGSHVGAGAFGLVYVEK